MASYRVSTNINNSNKTTQDKANKKITKLNHKENSLFCPACRHGTVRDVRLWSVSCKHMYEEWVGLTRVEMFVVPPAAGKHTRFLNYKLYTT
jgi:hypothetical protein